MTASQKDIARMTGLSRSTVSRALTNYHHTSERTKKLVLKAAGKLGYQKNALVSMLTAQVRKSRISPTVSTLAYITSLPPGFDVGEGIRNYQEYFSGVESQAGKLGYKVDVLARREPGMTRERFDRILQSRNIQGAIIAPRPRAHGHISINYTNLSIAALGHALPFPSVSYACPWHFFNISLALRHLVKLGFHRIGYAIDPLTDVYTDFSFSSRFKLYQSLLPAKNVVPMLARPQSRWTPDAGQLRRWLEKHTPDVLLCAGPVIPGLLADLGLTVPRDVSYVDLMQPSGDKISTGVNERPHEIGAASVDIVVALMHNNQTGIPEVPRCVQVPGCWRDGATLARR